MMQMIIIGNSGVGKTSIMDRYVKNNFNPDKAGTIGIDFTLVKYITQSGVSCKVKIWDTCGVKRAKSLTKQCVRNVDGAIVTFALDDYNSFKDMQSWLSFVEEQKGRLPMVIVGNKSDLPRVIEHEEAQ